MAQVSRRGSPVDSKDLKKSILNANKSLDAKNNRLKEEIKSRESEIKSLDKEIKSLNNEIKSLIETVSNNKTLLSKENIKLHNISKDIDDKNSIVLTLKNEESSINKNVNTLNKEALKLNNDIAYLETKKKKADDLIQDVDYLQKQKQLEESEINEIKGKSRSIKENISNQELFSIIHQLHIKTKLMKCQVSLKNYLKKLNQLKKN